MIRLADVTSARERIGSAVYRSPCPLSHTLSRLTGCRTFFKLENLQMTGSFKERGALNRLLQLDGREKQAGVVAASAGNHAQGVAWHAARLGMSSTIVMPRPTPVIKVSNTRDLGGRVVLHGESYDEALAHARRIEADHGLTFIHAFDDDDVIAGQGTIGLELLDENTAFDVAVVPVGGGGLIGGLAVALKEIQPGIRVIGVEPEQAACLKAALAAGGPVEIPVRPTIADGLAVRRIGERTLDLARRYLDGLVTVSEDEIASAILKLLEIEKTVVEGAGAAALAAVFFRKIAGLEGKGVVMILSGGNIDPIQLSKIIQRGLARDGRLVRIRTAVRDRPGELARVARHVAAVGANTLAVDHNRAFSGVEVGGVEIHLTLETRGPGHIEDLLVAMSTDGIECDVVE